MAAPKARRTPTPLRWKNALVRSADIDPKELLVHPDNWRVHTTRQREAMEGILSEVGWVGRVKVNANTGRIVNGHLRVSLALKHAEPTVPVDYVDLSADEEALVLATFDTITGAAEPDPALYAGLLTRVSTGNAAVQQFLAETAEAFGITPNAQAAPPPDEDGELLALLNVTLADPRHVVEKGHGVTLSGRHILLCVAVLTQWSIWVRYLQGAEWIFCPYPGPFVALSEAAKTSRLLLVQPDPYLCGHILDRYSEIYGEDSLAPLRTP